MTRWNWPILPDDAADLLIVETDAQTVSTAELLPRGTQWRSLAEFGANLDAEDRVQIDHRRLINGLQPAAVLVMGSRAGWEMLARLWWRIRSGTALFAAVAASPDSSAADLLGDYLRKCIHVLSTLYGPERTGVASDRRSVRADPR